MSPRLMLLKYKGFLGRLMLFVSFFMFFHYLVIPTLIIFKRSSRHTESRKSGLDDMIETLMYYKPLDVVTSNGLWQVVNDPIYEVYLLSAFFDDRPSLKHFHVRVVAVAEITTEGMVCLLWYRNQKEPDPVPANMTFIGPEVEQHHKMFQGLVVSCEVPALRWPPEWVSIVGKDSIVPSNLIQVEMPFRPPMLKDIAVCVPPSYGPLSETRFTEWIEILTSMGVTKVIVYDNGLHSNSLRVIKRYAEKGNVDLRKAKFPMETQNTTISRKLLTIATINDCFYRNMMEHSKIVVKDVDEIIIPRIHDTYPELVTYIDDTLPTHPGRSYIFDTAYFWLDYGPFTEDTPFMTVTRYLMRSPPTTRLEAKRSITDTQVCLALNTHKCEELLPGFKNLTDWLTQVSMNISLLHHYKKCDLDEEIGAPGLCNKTLPMGELDATATKYVDKVTTQIVETLWKFDLVDIFNLAEESVKETMEDEQAMEKRESVKKGVKKGVESKEGEEKEEDGGEKKDEGDNKEGGEEEGGDNEEGGGDKEEKEEELDVPMDPMVILKDTKVAVTGVPKSSENFAKESSKNQGMGQTNINAGDIEKTGGEAKKIGGEKQETGSLSTSGQKMSDKTEQFKKQSVQKSTQGQTQPGEVYNSNSQNKVRISNMGMKQVQREPEDLKTKPVPMRQTVDITSRKHEVTEGRSQQKRPQTSKQVDDRPVSKSGKSDGYIRNKTMRESINDNGAQEVNVPDKLQEVRTENSQSRLSANKAARPTGRKHPDKDGQSEIDHTRRKLSKETKHTRTVQSKPEQSNRSGKSEAKNTESANRFSLPFPTVSHSQVAQGKGNIKMLHIIET